MRLPASWRKQSCPLSEALLQVESLEKAFRTRSAKSASVKAVAGVSFTLRRGETLGLVGESGCGKSTLSRLILSLLDPDAGKVSIDGIDFTHSSGRAKREARRRIQIVFQDALSSLNPRMTVGTNIAEPMRLQGLGSAASRRAEAQRLLEVVGLRPEHEDRYRTRADPQTRDYRLRRGRVGPGRLDTGADPAPHPRLADNVWPFLCLRLSRPRRHQENLRPRGRD